MPDSLECSVTVALSPADAFSRFTDGLATWWPHEYTWSQDALQAIGIEPRLGGFCFEIGPHGFRCDWGRVLAWESPARLVFAWQISMRREPVPDPAKASEVEVTFAPESRGVGTRVHVVHRAFARHGANGEEYRAALASEYGWPLLLDRFARAAA